MCESRVSFLVWVNQREGQLSCQMNERRDEYEADADKKVL